MKCHSFLKRVNLSWLIGPCVLLLLLRVTGGVLPEEEDDFLHENITDIVSSNSSNRQARRTSTVAGFFKIVSFDNYPCDTTNGLIGSCYSPKGCRNFKGTPNGACASNYGVCCLTQFTCGDTIDVNNSYFVNPDFPKPTTGPLECTLTLLQVVGATDFYLEFVQFDIRGPSGPCTNDTFIITEAGTQRIKYPTLCGVNTGQHIYVPWGPPDGSLRCRRSIPDGLEEGNSNTTETEARNLTTRSRTARQYFKRRYTSSMDTGNSAKLTFKLAPGSDPRIWQIRIVQFKHNDSCNSPDGCMQFHQALTGSIQSYNFDNGQGEIIENSVCVTQCIAVPTGYCRVVLTEKTFVVSGMANNCTTDYLLVAGLKYCGDTLGTNGTVIDKPALGTNFIQVSHCSGLTNDDMDVGYDIQYTVERC